MQIILRNNIKFLHHSIWFSLNISVSILQIKLKFDAIIVSIGLAYKLIYLSAWLDMDLLTYTTYRISTSDIH